MSVDSALLLHPSTFRAYSAIFYHNSIYFKDVVLMRGREHSFNLILTGLKFDLLNKTAIKLLILQTGQ